MLRNVVGRDLQGNRRQSQRHWRDLNRMEWSSKTVPHTGTQMQEDPKEFQRSNLKMNFKIFLRRLPQHHRPVSLFFSATLHVENSAPVIQHPEHQEEEDDEESIQQEHPERRARRRPQTHHQAGTSVSAQMDQIGSQQRVLDQRQRRQRTIYSPQI